MRELLLEHKDFLIKVEEIEKQLMKHDQKLKTVEDDIQTVFSALKELLNPPQAPRARIGFRRMDEEQ